MKSTLLIALLCSVCVINVNASEQVALNAGVKASGFSGERITVAGNDVNNALRLKFISRRGYQNPEVKNKDDYKADDVWVGATYIDERESKASKRLNRQFRSKRPYIDYQFD